MKSSISCRLNSLRKGATEVVNASHTHRGLKAAEQLGEEGVTAGQGQDPLLRHRALHIVILEDHVLLQHLHGIEVSCFSCSCKHHLRQSGGSMRTPDVLRVWARTGRKGKDAWEVRVCIYPPEQYTRNMLTLTQTVKADSPSQSSPSPTLG